MLIYIYIYIYALLIFHWRISLGVITKELHWGTWKLVNSKFSRAIMFTFGQIHLGKIQAFLFPKKWVK